MKKTADDSRETTMRLALRACGITPEEAQQVHLHGAVIVLSDSLSEAAQERIVRAFHENQIAVLIVLPQMESERKAS